MLAKAGAEAIVKTAEQMHKKPEPDATIFATRCITVTVTVRCTVTHRVWALIASSAVFNQDIALLLINLLFLSQFQEEEVLLLLEKVGVGEKERHLD
jgi:hypothetical protein